MTVPERLNKFKLILYKMFKEIITTKPILEKCIHEKYIDAFYVKFSLDFWQTFYNPNIKYI